MEFFEVKCALYVIVKGIPTAPCQKGPDVPHQIGQDIKVVKNNFLTQVGISVGTFPHT